MYIRKLRKRTAKNYGSIGKILKEKKYLQDFCQNLGWDISSKLQVLYEIISHFFPKLLYKDYFTTNQDKRRAFSAKVTFLLAFLQDWPLLQLKKVKLMNGTEAVLRVVCLPLKVFAELQRMNNMGMRGQSQYVSKYKNPRTTLKLPSDYI